MRCNLLTDSKVSKKIRVEIQPDCEIIEVEEMVKPKQEKR